MKIILVCLVLLFIASPVYAEWDNSDTGLLLLRIYDWGQTRWAAENSFVKAYDYYIPELNATVHVPDHYIWEEINPIAVLIIGKHPSPEDVDKYFISLIILDYLIDKFASDKIDKLWKWSNISIELYSVIRNDQVGVKFKIPI